MKVQIVDNGKITIPLEIRQRLGLREGDELLFSLEGNEVRLRPVKRRRLSEFLVLCLPPFLTLGKKPFANTLPRLWQQIPNSHDQPLG